MSGIEGAWWATPDNYISNDMVRDFFDLTKPLPKLKNYTAPTLPISSSARKALRDAEEAASKPPPPPSLPLEDPYYTNPQLEGQYVPGGLTDDDFEYSCYAIPAHSHTDVFDQYDFDTNTTPTLPIDIHKKNIVSTIEANQVTIIEGSTGSGKSTQVPQYILESYARDSHHCNIICTQPRRIAAMSVAKYVSQCRKWRLGSLVGYQIAMDKVTSDDTRLTFVTTGVLLMKLINEKNMNQYTHVILDEVHERDKDTDFCLLLVMRLLRTNSRNVKVILMSATLESSKFAKYFEVRGGGGTVITPPILNIEGQVFPVYEFFLDSLKNFGTCEAPTIENPRVSDDTMMIACKLMRYFDTLDKNNEFRGTVLVFLPGMPEIQRMEEKLAFECSDLNLTMLPLHSTVSSDEQMRVFVKLADKTQRKVILATNIAESSLTVPDIRYVIDFCLTKQLMYDPQTNYQYLSLTWASKASLLQRKGRAGRVANGRCYKLIPENFYIQFIDEQTTPEISRCPLESLVLHTKRLDIGDPKSVLRWAITPPNLKGIEKAVLTLKEVGGLTLMINNEVDPYDGHLTFLGEILSSLPVDVKVGKLLVLGHVFGVLEECLVIGASLSIKSIFVQPYHDEFLKSYRAKMQWSNNTFSDCLAILNAYKEWYTLKFEEAFLDRKNEKSWCKRNYINLTAMRELSNLVDELKSRLSSFNITITKNLISKHREMTQDEILLVKLVIGGAFYPNYFYYGETDEEMSRRDMSGHDPRTTVMVSGLPGGAEVFHEDIAELFNNIGEGKALHYEQSRLYVEFMRPPHHVQVMSSLGDAVVSVYTALKMKHRREKLSLTVPTSKLKEVSKRTNPSLAPPTDTPTLPFAPVDDKHVVPNPVINLTSGHHLVLITDVRTPGQFWAQYYTPDTQANLTHLINTISKLKPRPLNETIPFSAMTGNYCLALYSLDGLYYRGYVLRMVPEHFAQVLFIDYGNEECVPVRFVLELPQSLYALPRQAFECQLVGVKPPFGGKKTDMYWNTEAIQRFKDLTLGKQLFISVYSAVEDKLRVDLWDTSDPVNDIHVNELLVKEGWACHYEEPITSKLSHETLERQALNPSRSTHTPQSPLYSKTLPWPLRKDTPTKRYMGESMTSIKLRGPSNPYEVSFYSMANTSGLHSMKIEKDSVNSIVFNDEPQDKHHRLLVAANVALSSSGTTVLTRNTTLLPNIHGLSHLLCLLFCPHLELRVDPLKRQYIGAMCGLGFSSGTGMSLYPEHDMELLFDTLITQHDIEAINKIRSQINVSLLCEDSKVDWAQDVIKKMQKKTRQSLLDLMLRPRDSVEPITSPRSGWNLVPPDDLIKPREGGGGSEGLLPLYELHSGVVTSGERATPHRITEKIIILNKLKEMRRHLTKSNTPGYYTCPLCRISVSSSLELHKHFANDQHLLNVQDIEEKIRAHVETTPTS